MNSTAKKLYAFKGAVQVFGKIAANNYAATTWAASEAKARSNIAFRFKQSMGYTASVPVKLLGKMTAQ